MLYEFVKINATLSFFTNVYIVITNAGKKGEKRREGHGKAERERQRPLVEAFYDSSLRIKTTCPFSLSICPKVLS